MNVRRFGMYTVCGLALLWTTVTAVSQDKPAAQPKDKPAAPAQPSPEEIAKMMEEYVKAAAPGDQHKLLEPLIGKWKTVTKMWMNGPDAPPTETPGTCENKWVLGGRFVMTEQKGTMMGSPFEGMGFTGFDKARNMFVSSWIDNQGTQLITMKGGVDQAGKVFTYYGEMDEPMMKIYGRMVKYVNRVIDKDKHVFEIIDLHAGDTYKVFEITYTRQ